MRERERNQERKTKLKSKKVSGKKKGVQKKKLIDTPCESKLKIVIEEHVSSENVLSAGRC